MLDILLTFPRTIDFMEEGNLEENYISTGRDTFSLRQLFVGNFQKCWIECTRPIAWPAILSTRTSFGATSSDDKTM